MIYIAYLVVASLVVWFSILASRYIDMIDKKSSLSGAFLGGVLLSAVTSLPELFTSISATVLLDKPSLCIGNILGSDLFNIAAMSAVVLFFADGFSKAKLSKGHAVVTAFVVIIYLLVMLNMWEIVDFSFFNISITTVFIFILYLLGIKYLSSGSDSQQEDGTDDKMMNMSLRSVIVRFVLASICIIGLSILMTYITDSVAEKLNLGAGLAGAIFLGVATSLPELSSTVTLFRIGNYDIAAGNIAGSNIFNFFIICIVDVISAHNVWEFSDANVVNLLKFGIFAMVIFYCMLRFRSKSVAVTGSFLVITAYLLSLILN